VNIFSSISNAQHRNGDSLSTKPPVSGIALKPEEPKRVFEHAPVHAVPQKPKAISLQDAFKMDARTFSGKTIKKKKEINLEDLREALKDTIHDLEDAPPPALDKNEDADDPPKIIPALSPAPDHRVSSAVNGNIKAGENKKHVMQPGQNIIF
jgi:hypothetical protein